MESSKRSIQNGPVKELKRRRMRKGKETGRAAGARPSITVFNRQRAMRLPLAALQEFARRALRSCLKLAGKNAGALANLDHIGVVLVSDRRMAELHRRFLHRSGPTDVITFQHGEIFISAETARNHARRFGNSLEGELRLYIAHGLLHLHGFNDQDPAGSAEIERAQEKLVAAVLL